MSFTDHPVIKSDGLEGGTMNRAGFPGGIGLCVARTLPNRQLSVARRYSLELVPDFFGFIIV